MVNNKKSKLIIILGILGFFAVLCLIFSIYIYQFKAKKIESVNLSKIGLKKQVIYFARAEEQKFVVYRIYIDRTGLKKIYDNYDGWQEFSYKVGFLAKEMGGYYGNGKSPSGRRRLKVKNYFFVNKLFLVEGKKETLLIDNLKVDEIKWLPSEDGIVLVSYETFKDQGTIRLFNLNSKQKAFLTDGYLVTYQKPTERRVRK